MEPKKDYRKAYRKATGKKIPTGKHIHHIDGDRNNNSLDNLICVSREMHRTIHRQQWEEYGNPKDAYAVNKLGGSDPIGLCGENNPFYGKTHTEDTKEVLRKARLGMKFSDEVNISKGRPGRISNRKGVTMSQEQKNKISLAMMGNKNKLNK